MALIQLASRLGPSAVRCHLLHIACSGITPSLSKILCSAVSLQRAATLCVGARHCPQTYRWLDQSKLSTCGCSPQGLRGTVRSRRSDVNLLDKVMVMLLFAHNFKTQRESFLNCSYHLYQENLVCFA